MSGLALETLVSTPKSTRAMPIIGASTPTSAVGFDEVFPTLLVSADGICLGNISGDANSHVGAAAKRRRRRTSSVGSAASLTSLKAMSMPATPSNVGHNGTIIEII